MGHADFAPTTLAGVSLVSGQTTANVSVVLRRGAAITGVLRDPNGEPVADAEVELSNAFGFRGGRGGMQFQIGLAGGPGGAEREADEERPGWPLRPEGRDAGRFGVVIRKPGLATERIDPVKVPEEGSPEPLAVTLVPGAAIAGVVRTRNGNPVGGVDGDRGEGGTSPIGPRAQGGGTPTGPDGAFFLDGLKAGEAYDLTLLGGTGMARAGGASSLLPATSRSSSQGPVGSRGARSTRRPAGPSRSSRSPSSPTVGWRRRIPHSRTVRPGGGCRDRRADAVKSEDGTFLLEEVPAGTWSVVVTAKEYQPARAGSVVVEEGGTAKDVEVKAARGAALKGHVTDAATGRPVPNASISHEDGRPPAGPVGGLIVIAGDSDITTDADGRFEIDGLGAGKVRVTAKHPDYADASDTVDVKESGAVLELKMTAGGALAGTVVVRRRASRCRGPTSRSRRRGTPGSGAGCWGARARRPTPPGASGSTTSAPGATASTAHLRSRSSAPLDRRPPGGAVE